MWAEVHRPDELLDENFESIDNSDLDDALQIDDEGDGDNTVGVGEGGTAGPDAAVNTVPQTGIEPGECFDSM